MPQSVERANYYPGTDSGAGDGAPEAEETVYGRYTSEFPQVTASARGERK